MIKDIGTDYTPDGLAILGVSEIENKKVLEDLTQTANLKNRSYQIIHYNSPDDRGVDVALLYQEKYFHVVESKPYSILLNLANGNTKKTRDVLLVKGYLDQQLVYILVNHWPSRRGGEIITKPYRLQTAQLNKHIVDSLRSFHPDANYIIMGDLNDNPDNESLTVGIKAIGVKSKVGKEEGFYLDDMKDGEWKKFSLEGVKIAQENYRWGKLNGRQQYYTYNGGLMREESWRAMDPANAYDTVALYDLKDPTLKIGDVVGKNEGIAIKHGKWVYFDPREGWV